MDIVISPLAAADVEAVAALARRVWQHTYLGIISQEQIDYMLDQRYRAQRVKEELGMATVWWDQLSVDGKLAGFVSCLLTGTPGEMKLDKLYVDPQRQRLGIGRRLVDRVVARALENACETLVLAVNKGNSNAIAAYRKQGFSVRDSVSVDIGGGFVMDDFIMARSLLAPATGPQQP
ncbi:GNAT family N-acetyltransferase [Accumulibacter sp.]|uniref:GNAT family N-acetyltransferase n=1 Tax=Accumulibacter sp. TaxID=2053492 RepID=UPI0035B4A616